MFNASIDLIDVISCTDNLNREWRIEPFQAAGLWSSGMSGSRRI
jgi:hypothetical protein